VFPERFDPPLQHRPPPEHVMNTDPEHIQGPPMHTSCHTATRFYATTRCT
jgi:hypothetical protein